MSADPGFSDLFGRAPRFRAESPGRVNLMGDHTDYNGGFVFPAAIPQRTTVELAPSSGKRVRAWSRDAGALPARARVPVRPVRGQVLRLRDPAGPGMIGRVVRVQRSYLVPRADGRYVLGATVEERGFDLLPAAGGVYELLRDAHEVVPSSSELQIEELCVGLRPGTPDNLPLIGAGALEGLW